MSEKWITVKGNHILIKDGETVEQAMKRQFGESGVRDTTEGKKTKDSDERTVKVYYKDGTTYNRKISSQEDIERMLKDEMVDSIDDFQSGFDDDYEEEFDSNNESKFKSESDSEKLKYDFSNVDSSDEQWNNFKKELESNGIKLDMSGDNLYLTGNVAKFRNVLKKVGYPLSNVRKPTNSEKKDVYGD